MYKHIILLRHAKASSEVEAADIERPLHPRGQADAQELFEWLQQHPLAVERVLVSPSLRTRQTWDRLNDAIDAGEVQEDNNLYLASAGELHHIIQQQPDTVRSLMLIAHNPGLQQLAAMLTQFDHADPRTELLSLKFPTCCFVALRLAATSWSQVSGGNGKLELLWSPKVLAL